MKSFSAVFAGALCALTVCSCSMTSSLEPPVDDKALIVPQNYLGIWLCETETSYFTLDVTINKDSSKAVNIQILQKQKKPEKEFQGKWIPLYGGFFRTGDQLFLTVAANLPKVIQENHYNDDAVWMIQPRFYLLQVTEKEKELELRFVTFAEQKGKNWKAVQPSIRLKDNLVLSSTSEIQELLNSKTYRLTDPVYVLKRSN